MSECTGCDFCGLQDDDKPMIEIMDQLSPVILENFVGVAISDTVNWNLPFPLSDFWSSVACVRVLVLISEFFLNRPLACV